MFDVKQVCQLNVGTNQNCMYKVNRGSSFSFGQNNFPLLCNSEILKGTSGDLENNILTRSNKREFFTWTH